MPGLCTLLLIQLYGPLQPPDSEPFAVDLLAQAVRRSLPNWAVSTQIFDPRIGATSDLLLAQLECERPDVIGLSVPQGTYHAANGILDQLATIAAYRPLVVLGHAVPTYAPDVVLARHPDAVIVRGWGEAALISLLERFPEVNAPLSRDETFYRIPSLAFIDSSRDSLISTAVQSTENIPSILERSPGRFLRRLETSRGCHYGRCTFCTRPPGKKNEWYRVSLSALSDSLSQLRDAGTSFFTFTDEDFIGSDLAGSEQIADLLYDFGCFNFSLSVRADNIVNPKGDRFENDARKEIFRKLKRAGLAFVFVGMESLAATQLRRYGKGVYIDDSLNAIEVLKELGIHFELGFMLFDPFVTPLELQETATLLESSEAWRYISNLFSKMRVQRDTPYELMVLREELANGFNVELISSEWRFAHSQSAAIWEIGDKWSRTFHPNLRLLRNIHRQLPADSTISSYLLSVRKLDLDVLALLISQPSDSGLSSSDSKLRVLDNARLCGWKEIAPYMAELYGVTVDEITHWINEDQSGDVDLSG